MRGEDIMERACISWISVISIIFVVAVKGGDSLHAHYHFVILLGYHEPLCLIFDSITDRS
jgi:archaellum biogenesis protein FlaJ (TadC family)